MGLRDVLAVISLLPTSNGALLKFQPPLGVTIVLRSHGNSRNLVDTLVNDKHIWVEVDWSFPHLIRTSIIEG